MKTLIVLAFATTVLASGCASTMLDRRTFPLVIRSPLPAAEAFRRIYFATLACYPSDSPKIEASFSKATKRGALSITAGLSSLAVELGQFDVEPDVNGSVLSMRLRKVALAEFETAVPAWLQGKEVPCPLKGEPDES